MLRVTTTMTGVSGAPYYSTQYWDGGDAGVAAAAQVKTRTFWDSIKGLITTGLLIQVEPDVDLVDPTSGNILDVFNSAVSVVAANGNAPLPKATQGLVRLRTPTFVAGRRLQGRIFIPALANDAQVGGIPSTAFINGVNTALTALLSGSPDPVVYSKTHGQFAQVSTASVWGSNFAILRSRRD